MPHRDLLVSRQHRMLVSSYISKRIFGVRDVLIPSIKLVVLPGIFIEQDLTEVDYIHMLFDRHKIIDAERASNESLYTGPEAIKSIFPSARRGILTIFPNLATDTVRKSAAAHIPYGKLQIAKETYRAASQKQQSPAGNRCPQIALPLSR